MRLGYGSCSTVLSPARPYKLEGNMTEVLECQLIPCGAGSSMQARALHQHPRGTSSPVEPPAGQA